MEGVRGSIPLSSHKVRAHFRSAWRLPECPGESLGESQARPEGLAGRPRPSRSEESPVLADVRRPLLREGAQDEVACTGRSGTHLSQSMHSSELMKHWSSPRSAVHRADSHAGGVRRVDAWVGDELRHWRSPLQSDHVAPRQPPSRCAGETSVAHHRLLSPSGSKKGRACSYTRSSGGPASLTLSLDGS